MKSVSDEFKNSIKGVNVFSHGKIDIVDQIGTQSFDRSKIKKFEISGSSYVNEKILGNVSTSTITVELLGDQTKLINRASSKVIKPSIGISVSEVIEYVGFQDFLVVDYKFNDTTNTTLLYGSDITYKLNQDYVDVNVYPLTLKQYLISVLSFCGLTYSGDHFLNEDFIVEDKPFSNKTSCREIVGRIAEMAMSYVSTNSNNQIKLENAFKTINDLGTSYDFLSQFTHDELAAYTHDELAQLEVESLIETILKNNYWSLKFNEDIYKVNGINTLVLAVGQVDGENNFVENSTNVAIDGSIEITIIDNPFINTEAKRLSVIDGMFNVVNGYKVIPFNIDYSGFPHLEINDVIRIVQKDNSVIQTVIHEFFIQYNGSISGKLATYSPSITDTQYKNQTLKERVRNAEIKVNKVEALITAKASEIDEINGRLVATELKLEPEQLAISVGTVITDKYGNTIENVQKNFIFNEDGLEINSSSNQFSIRLDEQELGFYDGSNRVAHINNSELNIKQAKIEQSIIVGVHKIEKYDDESTIIRFVGDL